MNVDEMMNMIDKKVSNEKEKERQKEIETKNRFNAALTKIRSLKPRIDDLIKLANYAKDNGIDFNKRGWGGHEGYDTGMFYTNSWSHLVGFVDKSPIALLGINAGGACGDVDFRTNGVFTFGLNRNTKTIVEPSSYHMEIMKVCGLDGNTNTIAVVEPRLYHMETFIKKFDEFEREFYAYIEKVCK